jgi:hypothetical protein
MMSERTRTFVLGMVTGIVAVSLGYIVAWLVLNW